MFLTALSGLHGEANLYQLGRGKFATGRYLWVYVNFKIQAKIYKQHTRSSKVRCRIKVVVPQYSIIGGGEINLMQNPIKMIKKIYKGHVKS